MRDEACTRSGWLDEVDSPTWYRGVAIPGVARQSGLRDMGDGPVPGASGAISAAAANIPRQATIARREKQGLHSCTYGSSRSGDASLAFDHQSTTASIRRRPNTAPAKACRAMLGTYGIRVESVRESTIHLGAARV